MNTATTTTKKLIVACFLFDVFILNYYYFRGLGQVLSLVCRERERIDQCSLKLSKLDDDRFFLNIFCYI